MTSFVASSGLLTSESLSAFWKVLRLFLIPIGGGIPAGVLVAKDLHLAWQMTAFLYFVSDVILACVFEPLMLLFIAAARKFPALARMGDAIKESTRRSIARYGTHLGPLALIMVAFGVDPMTGRAAAVAAGHGFVTGWIFAIIGDMIYFAILMASTLWLNGILGDGTWTTLIILLAMMIIPAWVRRYRERARPA